MIHRTLLLLVFLAALSTSALASQSRPVDDTRNQSAAQAKVAEQSTQRTGEDEELVIVLGGNDPDSAAGVRKPMQDVKNVGQANQVENERFQVKEEFGQTQQQQRTRRTAPESMSNSRRMKQAEVEQAEEDLDAVIAGEGGTRDNGDKTNKNEAARAMRPCPAGSNAASSAAAAASAATNGAAATVAAGCTN